MNTTNIFRKPETETVRFSLSPAILAILLSILVNVLGFAYAAGTVATRLDEIERRLAVIENVLIRK